MSLAQKAQFSVKHLVIGGGVVGLAIAAKLSKNGSTLLVDKNKYVGEEISSHNSEVIHAGIYYPPGSLKAQTCINGRKLLYNFCEKYNIPHLKCGKWIMATTNDEIPKLEAIKSTARSSNVELNFLPKSEINKETNIKAVEVLYSPESGIVNSHQYMVALEYLIEKHEGQISLRTKVEDVTKDGSKGYLVRTVDQDGEEFTLYAESIINAAGLWSDKVAKMIMKDDYPKDYQLYFVKGHYFSYTGPLILKTPKLLYPIPEPGLKGLGVHATIDLSGAIRFGPDTKNIDSLDYNFDLNEIPILREKFYNAIKSYIPSINKNKLNPDYTGIRPKLSGPGDTQVKDFIIAHEISNGHPNLVNLVGIESPGLTASLAIADMVHQYLGFTDKFEL